jgi:hypothetical protein
MFKRFKVSFCKKLTDILRNVDKNKPHFYAKSKLARRFLSKIGS